MKNLNIKIVFAIIILITASSTIYAQLPPGFGDTSIDDTSSPAPISGLVILGIIVGSILGYKKLNR